jgi:hypothetical protein
MLTSKHEHYITARFSIPAQNVTTPSLDFDNNFRLLEDLCSTLYSLKDNYASESIKFALDPLGMENVLEKASRSCLSVLNKLTKRQKRHASKEVPMAEIALDLISTHSFDPTLSLNQKARYHLVRGKMLNVLEKHQEGAESNLQKAGTFRLQ